jgi:protein farnesyltransferase subunit beta
VISTFQPLQNPSGGFGGGHQQFSHIAPTYAAVLSLASVDASSLSMIDRRSMVRWLHSLKNADGSFSMCVGGEIDVRGIYCALAIISLLRLPTDSGLLSNTTRYLASCQTYEGGFASNFGGTEAHGGYAFCALAALCILHPPTRLLEIVDMDALVRWLSARQYAPEGGISGRTNKLVDGCYSTWVGGCWALVEAALEVEKSPGGYECLWSREGLIRYILTAAQSPQGGLRDKPGKGPDYYHSAYILLGLSTAMHYYYYDENAASRLGVGVADPKPLHKGNAEEEEGMPLMAPFAWKFSYELPGQEGSLVTGFEGWPDVSWRDDSSTHDKQQQGGEGGEGEMGMKELKGDRVAVLHPLFNIRYDCVLEAKIWADGL